MKFKEFKKKMKKNIFSKTEAQLVAFETSPEVLKLQLHQWVKSGDLIALKKGLYVYSDVQINKVEIAKYLYFPSYISLEYALSIYGIIPDVPFSMTMITTKTSRTFDTVFGQFIYHKIKGEAFFGFDTVTLIAEREKALVDYFYFNTKYFVPNFTFWEEQRFQNLNEVDFSKAYSFLEKFNVKKLTVLLRSLEEYAATIKNN
jgi:predicted transcriptional regulator of viral defense system